MNAAETPLLPEMITSAALVVGGMVVLMYVLRILDGIVLHNRLAANFAIKPRDNNRLLSVVLAHFIHANRQHLFANTVPFAVLAFIIALSGLVEFAVATIVIMLVAGLGTWIFGSQGHHLGASGLITGYFGFILARGWFTREPLSIIIAVIVGIIYFGILSMAFGRRKGVSNVMHLFGFIGGIAGGWVWSIWPLLTSG